MSIPSYEELMRPVLEYVSDGAVSRLNDIRHAIVDSLGLSGAEAEEFDARGRSIAHSRAYWASYYLFRAGLLERPSRSMYRITERGRLALAAKDTRIDSAYLRQFEEFREWATSGRSQDSKTGQASADVDTESSASPDDLISSGVTRFKNAAVEEIRAQVDELTPDQFERLVKLAVEQLGYVGVRGFGELTARGADGGIDGVIHQDRLGLQRILLQAKKWAADHPVPRTDIDRFLGVLGREGVNLGVFITSSSFTRDAREGVGHLGGKVALVDGQELAELMYESGVGVTTESTIELKRVDRDFFETL